MELQTLFESPTVAELAERLRVARAAPKSQHPGRIPIAGRRSAADRGAADAPPAPD